MKRETPRNGDDAKLCAWCGGEIKQSGVGRSRDYCSRTHREYAYRARREAEVKLVAYSRGRADARTISSTDASRTDPVPSVDETVSAGPAPVPTPAPPEPVRPEAPLPLTLFGGMGFGFTAPEQEAADGE